MRFTQDIELQRHYANETRTIKTLQVAHASLPASIADDRKIMQEADPSILEQIKITEFEFGERKSLCSFTTADSAALADCWEAIEPRIETLVDQFYETQTSITELALLTGDSGTLARLRKAQCNYVHDLFGGVYDLPYATSRLRIGLTHKRLGVEPKLYLAAMHTLKNLLSDAITLSIGHDETRVATLAALEKIFFLDITLVLETYIGSLVSEVEAARQKTERHARNMEETVRERTRQLEELSRTDPLTGLRNVRDIDDIVTRALHSAERRSEALCVVFFDLDDFKKINDTEGHQRGDEVLRTVGRAVRTITRTEDACFRYGGDEFCVVLSHCTADDAQENFVERLRLEVARAIEGLTLSVGVAQTGPLRYLTANEIIRLADQKMYHAKHATHARSAAATTGLDSTQPLTKLRHGVS